MIEALNEIKTGIVTRGLVVNGEGNNIVLWGSKTKRNPEGTSSAVEVIVIDSATGLMAVRRTVDEAGHQIDLYGYDKNAEATRQEKAKVYSEAFSLAESMADIQQLTDRQLDESKRSELMMIKLLTLEEIMAGLPPLFLHQTGAGNKYETEAYATIHGISIESARKELVLTPNSARIAQTSEGK